MSSGFEGIEGPWVAIRTEAPKGWNIEAREGTYTVAIVRDGNGRPENARHAFVIAEAGTILHETGLTPRQLAEQRADLLEALILMEREKSDYMLENKLGDPAKETTNKLARAAIANATQQRNATGGEG